MFGLEFGAINLALAATAGQKFEGASSMFSQEVAAFRGIPEDEIIDRIEGGDSIASIARELECNRSVLWRWINADEQRSARSARARQLAAFAWDELAERGINDAADPFELSKAKEMAHHYRWRASKIAPQQYGDKVETTIKGTLMTRDLTDADLANIAAGSNPAIKAIETYSADYAKLNSFEQKKHDAS